MKNSRKFIVDKFVEKWMNENKEMLEDYQKLCLDILIFRDMWGIEISLLLKKPDEVKLGGRYIPKNLTEKLFNAQKTIENIKKYKDKKFHNIILKRYEKNRNARLHKKSITKNR